MKRDKPEIMKWFSYSHLPKNLARISKLFCDLAESLEEELPVCEETDVFLRKLLESKDAAVRSYLYKKR